jgi:Tetratricopeptide repeat
MSDDAMFFTATMAKIHTSQGNYAEAARIYRHLLERDAGDTQIQEALADVEKCLVAQGTGQLGNLLGRWVDLILTYNKLHALKKLKSTSQRQRSSV